MVHACLSLFVIQIATAEQSRETAVVDFGRLVPDPEIRTLLERHDLRPLAAKTLISGATGTYRPPASDQAGAPVSVEQFVQSLRAENAQLFQRMLTNTYESLREFLARQTPGELAADERALQWGRELLEQRISLEAAVATVRAGRPIIFAVHVSGTGDRLDGLAREPGLSVIRIPAGNGEIPEPSAPPAHHQGPIRRSHVQSLDPAGLHGQIRAILKEQEGHR
jgi:hypothetical protein